MPFDPVQGQFIRDTIADVESLEISADDRERIYEGTPASCSAWRFRASFRWPNGLRGTGL